MYKTPTIELTPEQRRTAEETLRLLTDIGPMIEKAQACGIECSGQENLRLHLHDLMTNVQKHFITGQDPLILS